MSLKSPELTLIQERIQNVLADISLFVSETVDPENSQLHADSWNREQFLERVQSYEPTTWFAKPAWMSPVACARYGWKNIDLDLLQCVSCRSVLVGRLPTSYDPDVYEACRKRLEDQIQKAGHHPCCMWPGKPTPLSVFGVDGSDETSDAVVEKIVSRFSVLSKLGNELPVVDLSLLSVSESDVNILINVLVQKEPSLFDSATPQAVLESACVLALCGWETSELSSSSCPQVHCEICNRCSGMWNFITHRSQQEDETHALQADNRDAYEDSFQQEEEDGSSNINVLNKLAVGVSNRSPATNTMETNNIHEVCDDSISGVSNKTDSTSALDESLNNVAESAQLGPIPTVKALHEVEVEKTELASDASPVRANSLAVSEGAGSVLRKSVDSDVVDTVLCTAGSESYSAVDSTTLEGTTYVEDVLPSNLKTPSGNSSSPKPFNTITQGVENADSESVVNDLLQGSRSSPVCPERSTIKIHSSRVTDDSANETVMPSECFITEGLSKSCRDSGVNVSVTHGDFQDTLQGRQSVHPENAVIDSDDKGVTENRQEVTKPYGGACLGATAEDADSCIDNCVNDSCKSTSDVGEANNKIDLPADNQNERNEQEGSDNIQTTDIIRMTEQESLHRCGETVVR